MENQRGKALVKFIPVVVALIVVAVIGLVISTFDLNQGQGSSIVLSLEKTSGTTYINGEKLEVFIVGSGYGTLSCSTSNSEYANCYIEASKLVIVPGAKSGEAIITVIEDTDGVKTEYVVNNTEKTTKLSLSVLSGSAYTNGGELTATIEGENLGKLTCLSSNTKIATCEIKDKKLIITPGSTAGTATITVTEDKKGTTVEYEVQINKRAAVTPVTTTVSLGISKTSGITYVKGANLTATISGKNYGTLSCTTSDEKIATCSISGTTLTVTPVKEGTVTITVKEAKQNKTVTYKATIEKEVTLSLSNSSATIYVGGQLQELVSGTNYGTLTCTTSDQTVATCEIKDKTLTVTSKKEGTATITVKESKFDKTAIYKVTVKDGVSISLSNSSAVINIDGQVTETISGKDYGTLSCTTSNDKIATCSISGTTLKVNAKTQVGEAIITVKESKTNKTATYKVTVKDNVSISLSNSSAITYVGNEVTETISGTNYGTLSCTTSDSAIATCTISGTTLKVKTNKVGTATITVKEAKTNKTATYKVTVAEKSNLKVSLSLSSTSGIVYAGGSNLNVSISGKDYGQLTCSTTNSSVATCEIKDTTLTIKPGSNAGTATITVKESNKNSYVTFKVTNKKITLSLSSTSGTAYIGGDDLEIAISGTDYGTLTCESADENIAICAISGKTLIISPNTKVGSAIITVKENIGGLSVEYIVNVNEPVEYECATGVLVEDSEKGGYICLEEASVKDSYVCTEHKEETQSGWFCNGSYVESYSDTVIITCSTEAVTGPIEIDDRTYNCNNQYLCHIIEFKNTCVDGYNEDQYYCPTGWKTYAGSDENLICYKPATIK